MKFLILIFSCILISLTSKVNAQIEKGNWSLGIASTLGSLGNNSIFGFGYSVSKFDDSNDKDEIIQFNFAPRIAYVIRKDLAIGLNVILTHSNSASSTRTFFGAGPFARYYFKGNYLRPYAEIQGTYGNGSIKSESLFTGDQDFNVRYLIPGGAVGIAFPIKNIVHIDLAAAYNYLNARVDDNFNQNTHNMGIKIGVTVFLNKAKTVQN